MERDSGSRNDSSRIRRKIAWLSLFLIALAALAMVAIPVFVIMPFKSQSPQGLELSYVLRRWSPTVSLVGLLINAGLIAWLWRPARRWWRKAALIAALVVSLVTAWFARQNHFEWMFTPLPDARYAKVSEAGFVADDDMVIAVEHNKETAAYPIRQMAYHHLVQDVVGGTPIVATY